MPNAGLAAVALCGLWLCLWRRRWRYFGLVGIIAGLASITVMEDPDILISSDGRLMAVRAPDGALALSSTRREKRTAATWLTRAGQRDIRGWRAASLEDEIACDGLACIYRMKGEVVSLVNDSRALPEDCRRASIVISAVPVRGACPSATLVIDRFDLWRKGAHAVWLGVGGVGGVLGVRVDNVGDRRGARPWTMVKQRSRKSRRVSNGATGRQASLVP